MDRLTLCLLTAVHLTASNVLLPGDVMPLHYDVRLTYDIDPATNYSFFGVVSILITLKQSTSEIIMHAENFTISEDAITLRGADNPRVTSVRYDDIHNFLILGVDTPLLVGQNFTLTIPFRGNLKVGNTGAYICPYFNTFFNRSEYLITTQLEGVQPRKWFPCFDELTYKATFAFTIGHYKDYTAVSNMPIRNTSPLNALEEYWPWTVIEASFKKSITGFLWDQFETTPPVATYLLWLTVSILSYKETYAEPSHIKFRIWSQKGVKDQTSLALSVGPALLTHYQSWFNMPMPVHAYEMFAIPDCNVGLVEAWGLLSHREEVLLYNEKKPNNSIKAWTIFFIAHGLVHQWLNLVTMKWWTDVWLYEALCMYLAMTVGETIMEPPTWQRDAIASDSVTELLPLDTGKTSHPMAVTLPDPKNYSQIYDKLVYYKSTALIRMMAMVVGTNCFRGAIRRFITNHMYSTADHDDFWQELTEIGRNCGGIPRNVTVQQIMGTWTSQAGFPLLTVTRNYTDQTLTLRQQHYQLPGANASDSAWWIPLRVLSGSKDKEPVTYNEWLTNVQGIDEEHKFSLRTDNDKWILFNYDVIAPYRINYDRSNWLLLADTLTSDRFTSIPEANRIQLLSDAFNLAAHGRLDYGTVLQLVSYVRRETQYVPFRMAFDSLLPLYTRLKSTSHFHVFQKFVMRLLIKQYWQSGGLTKRSYDEKELYGAEMQVKLFTHSTGCDENQRCAQSPQWLGTAFQLITVLLRIVF